MKNKVLLIIVLFAMSLGISSIANAQSQESLGTTRYCIAFLHEVGKPERPIECFTNEQQFVQRSREIESVGIENIDGSGPTMLVLQAQIWDNSNWTGDTMSFYGSSCSTEGWLNSLDFMNNRASSLKMNCTLLGGTWYTGFFTDQNLSGTSARWKQSYDPVYRTFSGWENNNWESYFNHCCITGP